MKKLFKLLALLGLCATVLSVPTACSPKSTPKPDANLTAAACKKTMDSLRALQQIRIPDHLMKNDCVRMPDDFNINAYFSVLPHLSMEPGYVLDYVYKYAYESGYQVLYVRRENEKPLSNMKEYDNSQYKNWDYKIRIDSTEAGFFEYVVLQEMGGQFYLWWHANVKVSRIICARSCLEDIISERTNPKLSGKLFDEATVKKARALDCTPKVTIRDDSVDVAVMVFTQWGGSQKNLHHQPVLPA